MNQNEEKSVKKRVRRSNIAIERDVLNAVNSLVREKGFSKISLVAISQKANIEISVINRHFGSLEKLLDRYTQRYDLWLDDPLKAQINTSGDLESNLKTIVAKFISAIWKNKQLRELMIWEVSEDNPVTRKSAIRREITAKNIVSEYETLIIGTGFNPEAIFAVIVAGIYFILIRKAKSTFCLIDFSTKNGRKELIDSVTNILMTLVHMQNTKGQVLDIATKLKARGISDIIISEATGLSQEEVSILSVTDPNLSWF